MIKIYFCRKTKMRIMQKPETIGQQTYQGKIMITVSKFNVRIVNKGDKYGLNFCLTHDEDGDKAMVEFYDARHANTANKFGQFVSRYYVGTLLCKEGFYGNSMEGGLCLDGGNPDEWSVEADDMKTVLDYISGVAA